MIRYKFMAVTAGLTLAATIVGAGTANAAIGTTSVTNRSGGLCLDAISDPTHNPGHSGDGVQVFTCYNGAKNQSWTFNGDPGHWGTITNGYGLCLDAENDGSHNPSQNGDPVQVWSCNGSSQQLWQTYEIFGDTSWYELVNGAGAHLVLDARNDGNHSADTPGDPVQLYTGEALGYVQDNQLWNAS